MSYQLRIWSANLKSISIKALKHLESNPEDESSSPIKPNLQEVGRRLEHFFSRFRSTPTIGLRGTCLDTVSFRHLRTRILMALLGLRSGFGRKNLDSV